MQHPAAHDHSHNVRSASHRSLWIALAITAPLMAAELVGGLLANSLALVADSAHMAADVAAISLALFAMWLAARPGSFRRTFGFYRAEVIAALCNALGLWLIAAWVFVEAYQRFSAASEVQGPLTLVVGAVGLVANVAAAWVLQRTSGESINVEGALLHVLGDLVGSVGVIIAATLVIAFGWHIADPIIGTIIGVLILFRFRPAVVEGYPRAHPGLTGEPGPGTVVPQSGAGGGGNRNPRHPRVDGYHRLRRFQRSRYGGAWQAPATGQHPAYPAGYRFDRFRGIPCNNSVGRRRIWVHRNPSRPASRLTPPVASGRVFRCSWQRRLRANGPVYANLPGQGQTQFGYHPVERADQESAQRRGLHERVHTVRRNAH